MEFACYKTVIISRPSRLRTLNSVWKKAKRSLRKGTKPKYHRCEEEKSNTKRCSSSFRQDDDSISVSTTSNSTCPGLSTTIKYVDAHIDHQDATNGTNICIVKCEQQLDVLQQLKRQFDENGAELLKSGEILDLIKWKWDEASANDALSVSDENKVFLNALLFEYKDRARSQIRVWFGNTSFKKRLDTFQNHEGLLLSHEPEDMMCIINAQIEVAKEYLPPNEVISLTKIILEEIQFVQQRKKDRITQEDPGSDVEYLCTVVNDALKMSENIILMESQLRRTGMSDELEKKAVEVETAYIDLALHASHALSKHIFVDLTPIVAKINTVEWESAELIPTCLATFADYFTDFELWLDPLFYGKCVQKCLEDLISNYFTSLFGSNKDCIKSPTVVHAMLEKDRLNLLNFFGEDMASQMSSSRHTVEEKLEIFRAFSSILVQGDPKQASDHIRVVLKDLGNESGTLAIMHLIKLVYVDDRVALSRWKYRILAESSKIKAKVNSRNLCDLSHLAESHSCKNQPLSGKNQDCQGNDNYTSHDDWRAQLEEAKHKAIAKMRKVKAKALVKSSEHLLIPALRALNHFSEQDYDAMKIKKVIQEV